MCLKLNLGLGLGNGRQAIYNKILQVLTSITDVEVKHRLVDFSIEVFKKNSQDDAQLRLRPSVEIRSSMSSLLQSNKKEYQKAAHKFRVVHFTNRE